MVGAVPDPPLADQVAPVELSVNEPEGKEIPEAT
jgi:hypothetical protein